MTLKEQIKVWAAEGKTVICLNVMIDETLAMASIQNAISTAISNISGDEPGSADIVFKDAGIQQAITWDLKGVQELMINNKSTDAKGFFKVEALKYLKEYIICDKDACISTIEDENSLYRQIVLSE